MTNLGDYIGRILIEVMFARSQADVEALRVAEIYSSHPLLQNFPVPRVRLPKAEINVPLVISNMEKEEEDRSHLDRDKVSTRTSPYASIVSRELAKHNAKMDNSQVKLLRDKLKKKLEEIEYLRLQAISMITIAKELSIEAMKVISSIESIKSNDDKIRKISKAIEAKFRDKLVSDRKKPPRIKVSPLTSQIKEFSNIEHIVTLKLSLIEDALEWDSIEEDGEERKILIPE